MTVDLRLGDCVEWARSYSGEPFHALLCDPPYELAFMGRKWDASGIAFNPDTWAAFLSVMYPGAFGMAFASSRGWHRLACAIEDAGFVIHPSLFGWSYGSGFPKATRVDAQIDKQSRRDYVLSAVELGLYIPDRNFTDWTREDHIPSDRWWEKFKAVLSSEDWHKIERRVIDRYKPRSENSWYSSESDITAPATDLARAFQGHRYGLQALKPALEPIIVFQRPYEGRPVENITRTGAGVLAIDAARIPGVMDGVWGSDQSGSKHSYDGGIGGGEYRTKPNESGRWPANFLLLDEAAANALDRQSGDIQTNRIEKPVMCDEEANTWGGTFQRNRGARGYSDSGGASRFFFRVREQLDEADPVRYQAKASRSERDAGLEGMPLKERGQKYGLDNGGELPQQTPHKHEPAHNPHPTVKPLALARYLATLLLPPAEYAPRRIFVPFAGVASECIGSMQAGWEEVVGVELTEEYIPIARARVEHWSKRQMVMFT